MKRSAQRIFWLITLIFFLILAAMAKLVFIDRQEISSSAYNPRINYVDNSVKRGNIRDSNGDILAESIQNADGSYTRNYNRSRMAAHITGYSSKGKTGVEAAENFELQKAHNEVLQRINNMLKGEPVQGNDVVLTIDMDIQSIAGNILGNKKGAIVVIEPSTGKILALQAYPDFDPNTVAQNWEILKNDEDSSLVNRATQGLYPPGSTFKVITALAALEYYSDWKNFTYECTGEATFENKVIHCYNNKVHGTVDMKKAIATSCNCYFAELGKRIGAENIRKKAEDFYFNQNYPFALAHSTSQVALQKKSQENEIVETAIGQGKTLATPLHMAMVASAVANDGIMMKPYIVDHIQYYNGDISKTTVPEKIKQVISVEEANIITDMMISCVSEGTGTAAQIYGVEVAGKTGTAENATGSDHSWFIGFAPANDPKIAVTVMIENANQGGSATPIAGKVLQAALQKYQ
ncbi:penicillin-binding transpeptidase domain-containing protein [Clostridium sp. MD294]|uniref:peptidoglycan D,D-transpeptidase FtsI family protein n=1 Tax=Clostridium sp. MD294 TaxID=97138 RepID=UPI001FA7A90D|nr:penicillin-binding transpeptidase domain-containing protein [Clostridium sp. MD294]